MGIYIHNRYLVFSTDKVSFQDKTRVAISVPKVMDMSARKMVDGKSKEAVKSQSERPTDAVRMQAVPVGGEDSYEIFYTTDGREPSPKTGIRYTGPIAVDKDVTIKAVAVDIKGRTSKVAEAHYVRYTRDKDLTYVTKPNPQYYAGGDAGLVDNQRGKVNYRIGGKDGVYQGVFYTGSGNGGLLLHMERAANRRQYYLQKHPEQGDLDACGYILNTMIPAFYQQSIRAENRVMNKVLPPPVPLLNVTHDEASCRGYNLAAPAYQHRQGTCRQTGPPVVRYPFRPRHHVPQWSADRSDGLSVPPTPLRYPRRIASGRR